MKYAVKRTVKQLIALLICFMAGYLLIIENKSVSDTVKSSIEVCLEVLIPSMCGFMILSTFILKSKIITCLLKPLEKFLIKTGLNSEILTAFILSQIGGYPVGVKLCNELILSGYKESYIKRLLYPMYASGPAFVTGIAGMLIYNSTMAGMIIFMSNLISNVIIMLLFSLKYKNECKPLGIAIKSDLSPAVVNYSVISSFKALFVVCSYVIAFNIGIRLVCSVLPHDIVNAQWMGYLKAFVEISNVKAFLPGTPLFVTAFFISFGGICVIFQIFSLAKLRLNIKKFIGMRIFTSLLSTLICYIAEIITGFEYSAQTAVMYPAFVPQNIPVLLCLTIMSGFLMKESEKIYKNNKNFFKKV